jgi:RNA binding exosome subunit
VRALAKACVEAFVYPTEDKEKVLKAMRTITSVEPEQTSASTKFGGKILILRSCTQKEEEIEEIRGKLGESRTLMLNKQRAFLGEIVPGNGIKVTFK